MSKQNLQPRKPYIGLLSTLSLTLSQTSPGFYMYAEKVF